MRSAKTFAVTGATGHLGVNLVLSLLERGHSVRALSHRRTIPPLLQALERLEWTRADVLDAGSLEQAFAGVDGVFHLAGKISLTGDADGSVWKANVDGARLVAQMSLKLGLPRLVYCSSVHALHIDASTRILDESLALCDGQSERPVYDRSKAAGLRLVESVADEGLSVVSVLPSGVIGPHDPAPSRMGRVFRDLRDAKLPAVTSGGFDFVDVRDVANGMIQAMERESANGRYVFGGHYTTLSELAGRAGRAASFTPPRFVAPLSLARVTAPLALGFSRLMGREPLYTPESIRTLQNSRPSDYSRARRELSYEPRPLDDTVRDIYASFQDPSRIVI